MLKALWFLFGLILLAIGGWILASWLQARECGRMSMEYMGRTSLRSLAVAQEDFRSRDRDGNGKMDFWKGDVAGLYTLVPKGESEAIRLVDLRDARADDRPLTPVLPRGPRAEYWFRALPHAEERVPDPRRFAFCAFPREGSLARWTYVIDEQNVIYRKDLGNSRGIEVFPDDLELKRAWSPLE